MRGIILSILTVLLAALMVVGCKKDKPKTKTADDVDTAEPADTDEENITDDDDDEPEPEPEPEGPTKAKFPDPPANDFDNRNPQDYLITIKKAQIVPAKPSMECWDDCNPQAQTAINAAVSKIGALGTPSQKNFDMAAKLMEGGIGLAGGQTSFPDIFVHMRCGHGQGHRTKPIKDKMVSTWKYENKKMSLDPRDECAISLWDSDGETDEEIGRVVVPLVQMANANNGTALIYGQEVGFGLVYSLEIKVKPADSESSGDSGSSSSGSSDSGDKTTSYSIEIIKAKVKDKKSTGQDWDAEPKGSGMLGGLAGKVGGKKPDVFVEAWKNGYKSQSPFIKTGTKKENIYPVWNESGRVKLKGSDHINFMVWDGDAVNHDIIGECKTKEMSKQYTGEVWLKNCGQVEYLLVKITKL